jgi:hypothetical protein
MNSGLVQIYDLGELAVDHIRTLITEIEPVSGMLAH